MERLFRVGDFTFIIKAEEEIPVPNNLELFELDLHMREDLDLNSCGELDYTYDIEMVDILPELDTERMSKPAFSRPGFILYKEGELETRYIGVEGPVPAYYACYKELSEKEARIYYSREWLDHLQYDTVFNSLFALEKRLLALGGMILHCAYMRYQGEAILFSAPSETGKSTQAGLWEKYRGSFTVNGDRSLLQQIDGKWYAKGWPICGSSEICHNQDTPIKAIVMLSQAKENKVERLSAFQAFQQIYSQITINSWNQQATLKAMDMIEDLLGKVPVYHLACDISENAVTCLEQEIYKRELEK